MKALDAPYEAGRRGAAWVKVKPVHTLDLVVLAVEWGSGRRRGWLSNLHLGARGPDGGFVMLGKTFKGLTDAMLAWQTEKLLELEERREAHVVFVRPELVVEIAFDGVQTSPRYPGGVALRFARVLRHRPDKPAAEADTLESVLARSEEHRDDQREQSPQRRPPPRGGAPGCPRPSPRVARRRSLRGGSGMTSTGVRRQLALELRRRPRLRGVRARIRRPRADLRAPRPPASLDRGGVMGGERSRSPVGQPRAPPAQPTWPGPLLDEPPLERERGDLGGHRRLRVGGG